MNRHVTNDKSQVQVIARAATILRALEDENAGLSLGQIAQRVNLARSTVQRIVAALETEKLVIAATPNGRVRLGPTILRLAASVRSDFIALARPFLERLSRGIARDRRSLDGEEGSSGVHRPGDRLAAPAHGVGGRRNLSALLHRQRQGLSGAALRCRRRGADRPRLRAAHAEDAHAPRCAARRSQSRAPHRRRLRPRGAHARHLRRRRRHAGPARQFRRHLGAGADASASRTGRR